MNLLLFDINIDNCNGALCYHESYLRLLLLLLTPHLKNAIMNYEID